MKKIIAVLALIVMAGVVTFYVFMRNDRGEYHPPGKLERKISARIDGCQSSQPCTLRLEDLTDFDWDRVYDFPPGTSRSQIEATIHTSFPDHVDISPWLVFVGGGRVVYAEERAWHVEKAAVNGVSFDAGPSERESDYPKGTQFIATRTPYENGYLYSLKSVH